MNQGCGYHRQPVSFRFRNGFEMSSLEIVIIVA